MRLTLVAASKRKTCGVLGDAILPEGYKTKIKREGLRFYSQKSVVHAHHRNDKKSQAKKAVDETRPKEMKTIIQHKSKVAGHPKGGPNPV